MTQESLAQRLGVERSTVVRWEAGDTEPLPSIRPSLARALHMSIDHLAELLAESKNAGTARTLPAGTEVTIPTARPPVAAELDRPFVTAEPQATIALDATPSRLPDGLAGVDIASADVAPVPTPVGTTGSAVPEAAQTTALHPGPADIQQRRVRSRRRKRFAAAGILALILAEGAVSLTSRSGPTPPTTATPAPVAAIPAPVAIPVPELGSGNGPHSEDSTASAHPAPVAVPNTPTDGPTTPAAAVTPARHTTRSDKRTTSRPKPPASRTAPAPPRNPVIPADAYEAWSEAASLKSEEGKERLRRERPSRP